MGYGADRYIRGCSLVPRFRVGEPHDLTPVFCVCDGVICAPVYPLVFLYHTSKLCHCSYCFVLQHIRLSWCC